MRAHVSIGQAARATSTIAIEEGYDQRQAVILIYLAISAQPGRWQSINQVEVQWRIIFIALLALSAGFAMRLHLFEPVLRHHYNPKTHQDGTVTPSKTRASPTRSRRNASSTTRSARSFNIRNRSNLATRHGLLPLNESNIPATKANHHAQRAQLRAELERSNQYSRRPAPAPQKYTMLTGDAPFVACTGP